MENCGACSEKGLWARHTREFSIIPTDKSLRAPNKRKQVADRAEHNNSLLLMVLIGGETFVQKFRARVVVIVKVSAVYKAYKALE